MQKRLRRSAPPSAHAIPRPGRAIRSVMCPSRSTRTTESSLNAPTQTPPSRSRQIPSGSPMWAKRRRKVSEPSGPISNCERQSPLLSATIRLQLSADTAMPLGKWSPVAPVRATPSGVTRTNPPVAAAGTLFRRSNPRSPTKARPSPSMIMSSIVPRATFEKSAYVVTRPLECLSSDRWNMAVTTVSPVGRKPMPAGTSGTSHRVSQCPALSILTTVRARLSTSQRNPSRQRGPSKYLPVVNVCRGRFMRPISCILLKTDSRPLSRMPRRLGSAIRFWLGLEFLDPLRAHLLVPPIHRGDQVLHGELGDDPVLLLHVGVLGPPVLPHERLDVGGRPVERRRLDGGTDECLPREHLLLRPPHELHEVEDDLLLGGRHALRDRPVVAVDHEGGVWQDENLRVGWDRALGPRLHVPLHDARDDPARALRELLERHRGARRVVLDVLADLLEECPGLVPAGDRVPRVLVAEDVGQTADDRAPGARVRWTRVHELARVGLHPRLELVRRPRRRLDLGGVVDEDGPPVAHDRRQQEALALGLQHLSRVGQLVAGEERVVLREESDELAVVGEHGAGVLPDEEQVHVDTSRVLLRLDLRGQLRRGRALDVHRLDLLRMGLRVVLDDDARRREITGDVDDGDRDRPLGGGVAGRIDGDPRQRKRERDGRDEGASHQASSGKAPRWYSNARTVSRRARASHHPGGVEGGGQVADVDRAVVAHADGDHVEPASDVAEALPLEVVLGEAHEAPALPPFDRRRRGVAPARLTALHLDEHPCAPVAADQVELAAREPHVPLDDGEASLFEEARRGVLCPPAKRTTVVSHAASVRHAALRENVQSLEHSESAATVTLTSRWPSRTRADTSGHGDDPTL